MSDPYDVRLSRRRILVDGEPVLMMSGEVHYFRLHREDWASRLDLLVAAGCDTVATYMPWLVHELADGSVDLVGASSEYRDLAGFLDLAASKALRVIARPGPFVMAELKNEGLPFSVYDRMDPLLGWDAQAGADAGCGLSGSGVPRCGPRVVLGRDAVAGLAVGDCGRAGGRSTAGQRDRDVVMGDELTGSQ